MDTFDAILIEKGFEGLVANGREIRLNGNGPVDRLGKYKMSPYLRFSCRLVTEFIIFFPLNFIPVVGWFLFIVAQGKLLPPSRGFGETDLVYSLQLWPTRSLPILSTRRLVQMRKSPLDQAKPPSLLVLWHLPPPASARPRPQYFLSLYERGWCWIVGCED